MSSTYINFNKLIKINNLENSFAVLLRDIYLITFYVLGTKGKLFLLRYSIKIINLGPMDDSIFVHYFFFTKRICKYFHGQKYYLGLNNYFSSAEIIFFLLWLWEKSIFTWLKKYISSLKVLSWGPSNFFQYPVALFLRLKMHSPGGPKCGDNKLFSAAQKMILHGPILCFFSTFN